MKPPEPLSRTISRFDSKSDGCRTVKSCRAPVASRVCCLQTSASWTLPPLHACPVIIGAAVAAQRRKRGTQRAITCFAHWLPTAGLGGILNNERELFTRPDEFEQNRPEQTDPSQEYQPA